LDPSKKKGKKSHRGWMWATMNTVQRTCCFIYQKGRGKKDINHVLKDYKGHLLTDAYGVYTKYGKQKGVKHSKCLGHIRRYFDQSLENDDARATYALEQFFGPLYGIEEECKLLGLNYDDITEMRQKHAVPVLLLFREWLLQELPKLTERTPIYKAVTYALNHFDGMMIYTTDGCLPIDNNDLEREIRAIALGRHNHLFAGSHRGAERAAVMYSLIATCKLQNIDPSKWMSDVLCTINTHPPDKLHELLPQFWKPVADKKTACA
jgi:transposase